MDFASDTPRRRPAENIVPMINVVFLLLIFFLMSAQIAAPPPLEISNPESASEERPDAENVLFVSPEGTIFYQALQGKAALDALTATKLERLRLEADRAMDAAKFARLVSKLRSAGVGEIDLVTGAP